MNADLPEPDPHNCVEFYEFEHRQIKKLTETAALYKKKNTAQPFPTGKCFDSLI